MTIHLTAADYGAILPEIIVICGALLMLLLDVFLPADRSGPGQSEAAASTGSSASRARGATAVASMGGSIPSQPGVSLSSVAVAERPVDLQPSAPSRGTPSDAPLSSSRGAGSGFGKIEITTLVALLTLAGALAASIHLWVVGGGPAFPASFPMVTGDRFAQFFNFALLTSSALAILIAPGYIRTSHFDAGEFYSLVLFATAGMMLLASGVNLMILFLAIELLSLSLYILSGFDRSRPRSQEAGFKYFLLSSFASAFLIYGMALIYGATGSTALARIHRALLYVCLPGQHCPPVSFGHLALGSPFLLAGIGLMAVGFAFKTSIVPFHMWTPDVYEGAPTPITAFMSVATKAAVFAAFLRVFIFALGGAESKWFGIVWALAIATMVVGNVLALSQSNMKRLLAYSGIAHAGYILVALSADNALGVTAVAYYFLVYAFMNVGAFVLVTVLENRGEAGDQISSYRGLFTRSPWLATATAVFMFSLAGFPPSAGFFAKYYAFAAAVQSGHTELAIIGVITSVVSLGYYLRVVVVMFMQPTDGPSRSRVIPSWAPSIALVASVVGLFVVGLVPWFYNLALQAAHSII